MKLRKNLRSKKIVIKTINILEILGTPFNGLGELPDIENPAEGLRQAKLVHLLKANGHNVTDLGDLSGFLCQEIRDPETGINDFHSQSVKGARFKENYFVFTNQKT